MTNFCLFLLVCLAARKLQNVSNNTRRLLTILKQSAENQW